MLELLNFTIASVPMNLSPTKLWAYAKKEKLDNSSIEETILMEAKLLLILQEV